MALGVTGPMLRSAGLPWDLRKCQPYSGYETYDFEVPTRTTCDTYGRYAIRMDEVDQSRSGSSSSAWTGWPGPARRRTRG